MSKWRTATSSDSYTIKYRAFVNNATEYAKLTTGLAAIHSTFTDIIADDDASLK